MEDRQYVCDGGDLLNRVFLDGDAAAIVGFTHAFAVKECDINSVAVVGQRLVDGVVHYLIEKMMEAVLACRADLHAGRLAHRIQAFQHRDLFVVVDHVGVSVAP